MALHGIHPNELKTSVHTKTCVQIFIATFFITAQTGKQPRCPSAGECINKLWSIQIMEYYSELKINKLGSHKQMWKKLKCILLSERSQSEKATYCMIPTIWHSGEGKTMETVKKIREGWGGMNRGAQRLLGQ